MTSLLLLCLALCSTTTWAASVGSMTCKVAGDPFYTTFDGKRMEFQGKCVYNFASYPCDCHDETPMIATPFNMYVENTQTTQDATRAYTSKAHIDVHNHRISLRDNGVVFIDENDVTDQMSTSPYVVGSIKAIEVSKVMNVVTVTVAGDFIATWDARGSEGRHVAEITIVNPAYKDHLCGICGGHAKDVNGTDKSDTEIGNSWVVNSPTCL